MNRLKQLKADRNKGISMAVVLCVSAFFLAFAAAILYTAGLLTAQSNKRLEEERCYQLAKSYAAVLEQQLTKGTQKSEEDTGASRSFYDFANRFLDGEQYVEYDAGNPDATSYHFVTGGTDLGDLSKTSDLASSYGNIGITLRKEANAGEGSTILQEGTIPLDPSGNYTAQIEALRKTTVRKYLLSVDVTAYYEDVSYTYTTEFAREETYDVSFSYNGTALYWDEENKVWRTGNSAGDEYKNWGTGTDRGSITYQYLDKTTSCRYVENTYTEQQTTEEGGGVGAEG